MRTACSLLKRGDSLRSGVMMIVLGGSDLVNCYKAHSDSHRNYGSVAIGGGFLSLYALQSKRRFTFFPSVEQCTCGRCSLHNRS